MSIVRRNSATSAKREVRSIPLLTKCHNTYFSMRLKKLLLCEWLRALRSLIPYFNYNALQINARAFEILLSYRKISNECLAN